jgi:hypothetical protein
MSHALTNRLSILAMLVCLSLASNASALILTGGPSYTLPGGGSCTVAGIPSQTGGATLSCTGVNLAAHTHVYFGIRNNLNVNGNTMTGTAPAAGSGAVFDYSSSTASSITYVSTTTVADQINGTQPVSNQLVLTLTAGTATIVATGGTPVNNSFGDIERLFRVTSGSFSIRVDVKASDPFFGLGQACPAVFAARHLRHQQGRSRLLLLGLWRRSGRQPRAVRHRRRERCCRHLLCEQLCVPAQRLGLSRRHRHAVRHERGVHGRGFGLPARRRPDQRWPGLPAGLWRRLRSE